jgi:glycosyltransferase involved in cell wall biosynthesis
MNLLCVDQYSSFGGAQRCLFDLLPSFIAQGWNVGVAMPGEGPFLSKVQDLGLQTHSLRCNTYTSTTKPARELLDYALELPRTAAEVARLCRSRNIDLLYVNGPRFLPAAAWAARLHSTKLVFHCHHRLTQRSAIELTGRSIQFAQGQVIACCRNAFSPLQKYVPGNRHQIVFNGVGPLPERPRSGSAIRNIGVIGRIEKDKGQLDFIRAIRSLPDILQKCTFSIIGAPLFSDSAYYERVLEESEGLPVTFMGWQEDISKVFPTLDLLVVPSGHLDATPRVVMEAFAARVPVVALPAGGIVELIEDGQTGFLASSADASALAARIRTIVELSPEELDSVVDRARTAWESRYSLPRFQQQICSTLAECAGEASDFQAVGMAASRKVL